MAFFHFKWGGSPFSTMRRIKMLRNNESNNSKQIIHERILLEEQKSPHGCRHVDITLLAMSTTVRT